MKLPVLLLFAGFASGVVGMPSGLVLGYQDTLGQYSFGYSAPSQARSEARSLDGVTRGSYSYVDAAGLVQSTDYTADGEHGFRVAATNLPQAPAPVQETPEVAAARSAHLKALEQAAQELPQVQQDADSVVISAKIATPEQENPAKDQAEPEKSGEEIIVEAAAPEGQASDESQPAAAVNEEASKTENQPEAQEKQKGRTIEEPVLAPWISPVAGSLHVPLIPVNFDLPSISAYSGRPAAAKAEQTLPQATPDQGHYTRLITPAGTTLKTLPAGSQFVPQAEVPQGSRSGESAPVVPTVSRASSAREYEIYERPAVYAPVGSVIQLQGYNPTIPSFLRYAPFPYIAYNVV
ncbi:translation initiation factor IF-2-like isoform X1 [Neodiprion virginianus]|uniref:translation initiation factor IF-2-like isoform X1 n=1 Tax=Neodiprion virginianus TaxID=2961670 RepID=UPI001EE76062|nr:translation initiation factor IF-2-like isoform X1 [Neodiprion virginianus]